MIASGAYFFCPNGKYLNSLIIRCLPCSLCEPRAELSFGLSKAMLRAVQSYAPGRPKLSYAEAIRQLPFRHLFATGLKEHLKQSANPS